MIRTLLVPLAITLGAVASFHGATAQNQQPLPRPLLSLEPAAGSPGSAAMAKGSGFRGDCRVRLYFDSESEPPLGAADVDRSGAFSTRLVIPEQAAGEQHVVLARALRPGTKGCVEVSDNKAEASYTLTLRFPTLVIDTRQARPGKTVGIQGRGFCGDPECSSVTVLMDGQVAAGGVKVSPAGTFSVQARVPATKTAGKINVVAVQTLANQAENRGFGELEVTPRPDGRPEPVR